MPPILVLTRDWLLARGPEPDSFGGVSLTLTNGTQAVEVYLDTTELLQLVADRKSRCLREAILAPVPVPAADLPGQGTNGITRDELQAMAEEVCP